MQRAVVSTAGAEVSERVTDAFMKVIATAPSGRTGYAAQTAVASGPLDPVQLAERAAAKAVFGGEATALAPGEYTVVLEPPAVAELLWAVARTAFDGMAHAEHRGALEGRLGTRVASPTVNISDSPRYGSTLPRAFDAEGVPKGPLPLIQDGVAHRVVHHTRSAALADAESTGHARVAADSGRAAPTNLVMVGGGAADQAELCVGIERGIYVTRLWYTNILRPAESLFTAVTRDGTFLIEDGQVTRPVADLRVTDSALGILGRIEALGARSVLTSDGELYGRRFAHGTGVGHRGSPPRGPRSGPFKEARMASSIKSAGGPTILRRAKMFATNSSANTMVQRVRFRSTSEPPPSGPAPPPTPKAPESPASLPECRSTRTMMLTARITWTPLRIASIAAGG